MQAQYRASTGIIWDEYETTQSHFRTNFGDLYGANTGPIRVQIGTNLGVNSGPIPDQYRTNMEPYMVIFMAIYLPQPYVYQNNVMLLEGIPKHQEKHMSRNDFVFLNN